MYEMMLKFTTDSMKYQQLSSIPANMVVVVIELNLFDAIKMSYIYVVCWVFPLTREDDGRWMG